MINHLFILRITLVIKEVTACVRKSKSSCRPNAAMNLEEHRPLSSVQKTGVMKPMDFALVKPA